MHVEFDLNQQRYYRFSLTLAQWELGKDSLGAASVLSQRRPRPPTPPLPSHPLPPPPPYIFSSVLMSFVGIGWVLYVLFEKVFQILTGIEKKVWFRGPDI